MNGFRMITKAKGDIKNHRTERKRNLEKRFDVDDEHRKNVNQ